ncbi:MAG: hypothetical protein HY362_04100 [Candidatus Aenigmarchaeota archaeon]|nr:hypothetical protein [Candidatus Aenigmarchaeota archaeon]
MEDDRVKTEKEIEETRKDMQRYFMRKAGYAEYFDPYSGAYAANFST